MPRVRFEPLKITTLYEEKVAQSVKDRYKSHINRESLRLVSNITDDMRDRIAGLMHEGIDEGRSVSATASTLLKTGLDKGVFRSARRRAYLISRTELHRARQQGAFDLYRANHIDLVKWIAIGDERTCDTCAPRNNHVYRLSEIEGDLPPIHPRCRCRVVPSDFQLEISVRRDRRGKIMETRISPTPQNYKYYVSLDRKPRRRVKKSLEKAVSVRAFTRYVPGRGFQRYKQFQRDVAVIDKPVPRDFSYEIANSGEDVANKIEERREGKVRATYAVNAVRAWNMEAKNKYPNTNYLGDVGVRECLQNSLDAVTESLEKGEIKRGKIEIELTPHKEKYSVKDNGIGMSDTDIRDKFLALYGTGKDIKGRFGGFGIAKAVILAPSESSHWQLKTRDNFFDDKMASANDQIKAIPKIQGTQIDVWAGEDIVSEDAKKYVETTEVPKNIGIRFKWALDDWETLKNPFLKLKSEVSHTTAKGSEITMSFFPRPPSEYRNHMILRLVDKKTGAKLTQAINPIFGGFKGALVVDIETSATPGSGGYPLTDSRMGLKWGEVQDFVNTEISQRTREKKSAERVGQQEKWLDLPEVPGWKDTLERIKTDTGYAYLKDTIDKIWQKDFVSQHLKGIVSTDIGEQPFTSLENIKILRDVGFKGSDGGTVAQAKLMLAFESLAQMYSQTLQKAGMHCPLFGFHALLSKATSTGVRLAHFSRQEHTLGLDIKSFPKSAFASPVSLALEMVNTIQHEFTHNWRREHDEGFTSQLGQIQTVTAPLFNRALEVAGALLGKDTRITIDTPQGIEKIKRSHIWTIGEKPKQPEWRAELFQLYKEIGGKSGATAVYKIAEKYNIPEKRVRMVLAGYKAAQSRKEKKDVTKSITESSVGFRGPERTSHPRFVIQLDKRLPDESRDRSQWADSRIDAEAGTGRLGLEGRSGRRGLLVIEKARSHKYLRKIPRGSGRYEYIYQRPDVGFHGTTSKFLETILKEGLRSSKDTGVALYSGESQFGPKAKRYGVYFAKTPERAFGIAEVATKKFGGKPVIFIAKVDPKKAESDEDFAVVLGDLFRDISRDKPPLLTGNEIRQRLKDYKLSYGETYYIPQDTQYRLNTLSDGKLERLYDNWRKGGSKAIDEELTSKDSWKIFGSAAFPGDKPEDIRAAIFWDWAEHKYTRIGSPFEKKLDKALRRLNLREVTKLPGAHVVENPAFIKALEEFGFFATSTGLLKSVMGEDLKKARSYVRFRHGKYEHVKGWSGKPRLFDLSSEDKIHRYLLDASSPEIEKALQVVQEIHAVGGQTLFIGGCVRDALLGKKSKDIDLEVYNVKPEEVRAILDRAGKVDQVGKSFGVFKLSFPGMEAIDVAIPRRESKTGKGHKGFMVDHDPSMTFKEAAGRRDLTINALAYNPIEDKIIDEYGGLQDIKDKILRATNPETFGEDSLRVLRVMRFAAQLEFSPDFNLAWLCRQIDLTDLPKERIFGEVAGMLLKAKRPSIGLRLIHILGINKILPELDELKGTEQDEKWHPEGDVWEHTLLAVDEAAKMKKQLANNQDRLVYMLGVLCHDMGKPETTDVNEEGRTISHGHDEMGAKVAQDFLGRLTDETDILERVEGLVRHHMRPTFFFHDKVPDSAIRRLAKKVDIPMLLMVSAADKSGRGDKDIDLSAERWMMRKFKNLKLAHPETLEPKVMGRHLIPLGIKPGPEMGRILDKIYNAQLEGKFETTDAGLEYANQQGWLKTEEDTVIKAVPVKKLITSRGKTFLHTYYENRSGLGPGFFAGAEPLVVNKMSFKQSEDQKRWGEEVVLVDVSKFDAEWSKDEGFYISSSGKNEISNRREKFQEFLKTGKPIIMPSVSVRDIGSRGLIGFTNGRHRFAVLRDMGFTEIPVSVDAKSAKMAKELFKAPSLKEKLEAQNYWWKTVAGGIESKYEGVKIVYAGKKTSEGFTHTYADEQFQDAIDMIPEEHRKLIDSVILEPGSVLGEDGKAEFGRVFEGTSSIHIYRGVQLHEYGTSFEEQFAHEVGHLVARKVFGSIEAEKWGDVIKGENPVSHRGRENAAEDFAETYSLYLNDELNKDDYPQRYKAIKNIVDRARKPRKVSKLKWEVKDLKDEFEEKTPLLHTTYDRLAAGGKAKYTSKPSPEAEAALKKLFGKGMVIDMVKSRKKIVEMKKSRLENKFVPHKIDGKVSWVKVKHGGMLVKSAKLIQVGQEILAKSGLATITAVGKDGVTARTSKGDKILLLMKDVLPYVRG
jgi:tRNA nucleotidyltransferase (CCA-adding enzyme)